MLLFFSQNKAASEPFNPQMVPDSLHFPRDTSMHLGFEVSFSGVVNWELMTTNTAATIRIGQEVITGGVKYTAPYMNVRVPHAPFTPPGGVPIIPWYQITFRCYGPRGEFEDLVLMATQDNR